MSIKDEMRRELRRLLAAAAQPGIVAVEVNSGELHRAVGGYPGPEHHMPSCCAAMYEEQRAGDSVVAAPPKGKGASLTIRYQLPR